MRCELRGSTILVTGGAGFIGSHLVDGLLAAGAREIVAVDNLFTGREGNLAQAVSGGRLCFYRDDLELDGTLDYILARHPIDVVFNCATKALNYSFVNPANAFATNTAVLLRLLEHQRAGRFRTLCHFSTSEVYGSARYEPMDEDHPLAPTTTYAAGKAAADLLLQSYVRMFGLDAIIVRPFNNYGPRQNHAGLLAGLIPVTAHRLAIGLPPIVHGGGEQRREFVHVLDTIAAVLGVYPLLAPGDSVNICGEDSRTVSEVISLVAAHFGFRGEPLREPARTADVQCHRGSGARLRALVRFDPVPFEQGLRTTLHWYQELFRAEGGGAP